MKIDCFKKTLWLFLTLFFINNSALSAQVSSKIKAKSYLKTLCASYSEIDSIIFYYIDFMAETPRSITRHDFINYSIHGKNNSDFKQTSRKSDSLVIKSFFDQLSTLECDSIMPYDTNHINCIIIGGKDGVLFPREVIGGDIRCMAILYRKKAIELLWFTRFDAYIGTGCFAITEDMKNCIDRICKHK